MLGGLLFECFVGVRLGFIVLRFGVWIFVCVCMFLPGFDSAYWTLFACGFEIFTFMLVFLWLVICYLFLG